MKDGIEINIIVKTPAPEEYNFLRKSVGWKEYDLESIAKGLKLTHYCVCAYDKEKIIGMGRIIGDNILVFYIQDVIVLPEYQKNKIGTGIMNMIMKYIDEHSVNNSIIGLMSALGKESFYEKYNFIKRPNEKMGCGMTIFVRK